jgi:branched-chain amino acid transport system permease protein
MDISLLGQLLINGLILGSIYALVAVGLSLIFGVLEIVNFAHGQIFALGAFAMLVLSNWLGLPYVVGVAASGVLIAMVGFLLYESLLKHLKSGEFERGIILTLAIGMILQNTLLATVGATPHIIDFPEVYSRIEFFGVGIEQLRLTAAAIALGTLAAVWWLLTRTRFGMAMRALAQNPLAATVVGMNPKRVAGHAVILGMGLTGMAGASLAPLFTVHPLLGVSLLFKAFAIVIIGGLGHIPGAAVAALIVGLAESFAGGLGSTVLQDVAVFGLMIVLLQVKPLGLFGQGVRI